MAATGRRSAQTTSAPTSMPEGTPAVMVDQSFTLQAIMEMQKELGVLGQKIEGMWADLRDFKSEGKETRDKLTEVEKSLSWFKGVRAVLGVLFALALVVVGAYVGHAIGK